MDVLRLASLEIKKHAALAPMAGVADRAFREICVEQGACYAVGEMVSCKGLNHHNKNTQALLEISALERPAAVQLFGDDPALMAKAALRSLDFAPDVIDVNMGCPAPKIVANNCGAALMKSPKLAGEVIKAVCGAVGVPATVKMRKGWDENSVNAVELALIAEENGAAAVTVHGRTRQQMYAPSVDLSIIAAVKRAVKIPVIGNGDVVDVDSAVNMYEATGCDLVMIGRGALGRPWVFRQIARYMETGERLPEPDRDERVAIMLEHIRRACLYKGERIGMREARKHVAWYLRGFPGAAKLRNRAGELQHFEELEELARYFA